MDTDATKEYIEFIIRLKLQQMQQGLNETANQLEAFQKKSNSEFAKIKGQVDGLNKKGGELKQGWAASITAMKSQLTGLTVAATAAFGAITAAAGVSLKTFADFQQQMNTLQAVSGASAAEMEKLKVTAQDLGSTTKYSASQMAATQVELAKLGFTSQEVVDSMRGIVSAAAASGESMQSAGELIAGTVRGFGLAAKDAGYVADVLAKSANISALSMGDLSLSMKYVAPVARASNQSLTDMVGIMALLSNNMIKGESAGTAMRAMMVRLQAPSGEAGKILENLGVKVADAQGKIKAMPQIIGELQSKLARFNQESQQKILAEVFGTEALSAASVLMQTSKTELDALIGSVKDASGASEDAGKIMQQGINHELDMMKSAAEGVANTFGEKLAPMAEEVIKKLTALLTAINDMPEPLKDMAVQVGLAAGGLALLTGGLGAATLGATKLLDAIKLLSPALSGLSVPQLLALAGPAAAGLGIGLAANFAINSAAANLDAQTADKDADTQRVADANQGLSKANKQLNENWLNTLNEISKQEAELRKTLSGVELDAALDKLVKQREDAAKKIGDISHLSKDAMQDTLNSLRASKTQFGNEANALLAQQGRIRDEMAKRRVELSNSDLIVDKVKAKARIEELQKQMNAVNQRLEATKGQVERVKKMEATFDAALKKREKELKNPPPAGNENFDPDADKKAREADQKRTKAAGDFIEQLNRGREQYHTNLLKQAQEQIKTDSLMVDSNSQMADKLIAKSKQISTQYAKDSAACYNAVHRSFKEAFGWSPFTDKNSKHAYMAADDLSKDKRFIEIQITDPKAQLPKLPPGAVVVWGKGTSKSGHISIADGKGTEMSDHAYQQMTSHYGGAKPRVFVLAGTTGQTKEQQEAIAQQLVMNQMIQRYNQDIAKLVAYRDQLPAQSEAWKKVDAEVFKLQQEAQQAGIDLTKNRMELEAKQREAAKRWALEQIDIDAAMLEAKAKLTEDTLDDIEAEYKRNLASIRAAELERLSQDGITEEQRLKLQAMYDTQRAAAEKAHQDKLKAYNKERADYLLNLQNNLEKGRIDMMQSGLDKQLALLELEKKQRLKSLQDTMDEEKKKWESKGIEAQMKVLLEEQEVARRRYDYGAYMSSLSTGTVIEWKDSKEYQEFQKKIQDLQKQLGWRDEEVKAFQQMWDQIVKQADEAADRLRRTFANNRILEGLQQQLSEVDMQLQERQLGVIDPARLDAMSLRASKEKLALQRQITENLDEQLNYEIDLAIAKDQFAADLDQVKQLDQQINESKARERQLELEGHRLILQGLERERQLRLQILNELAPAVELTVSGFENILGLNTGIGREVAEWTNMLAKGMSLYNPTLHQDGTVTTIDAESLPSVVGLAAQLKSTIDKGVSTFMTQAWGGSPLDVGRTIVAFQEFQQKLLRMDLDLQKARIDRVKERGEVTYGMEVDYIEREAEYRRKELEKSEMEILSKRSVLGIWYSREDSARAAEHFRSKANKEIEIEEWKQQELSKLRQSAIDKQMESYTKASEYFVESTLKAADTAAAMTMDPFDDIQAKLQRDIQAAHDEYAKANLLSDELKKNGNSDRAYEVMETAAKTRDDSVALARRRAQDTENKIYAEKRENNRVLAERVSLLDAENGVLQAQRTDDPFDDILADFSRNVQSKQQALSKELMPFFLSLATPGGQAKDLSQFASYGKMIGNYAEWLKTEQKNVQKKLADGYKAQLQQQKTYIQQDLDADKRQWDEKIRTAEKSLEAIREAIEAHNKELEANEKERQAKLKPWTQGDAVQSDQWKAEMAAYNADPDAWLGVDALSNVNLRGGLKNVSPETRRKGLLEEAELTEMRAQNAYKKEEITFQQFAERMQKAQLMRAKAAEYEMEADDLTTRRKIELEGEWADAYEKYQDYARQAIDARYDAEAAKIQENITKKQELAKADEESIKTAQKAISELTEAAAAKTRLIDDEVLRVEKSTRSVADVWADVAANIDKSRANLERLQSQAASTGSSGAAYSVTYGTPVITDSIQTPGQVTQLASSPTTYTSKPYKAKRGGFAPASERYRGDKYPVLVEPREAMVPFEKWPEILGPAFAQGRASSPVYFNPQFNISGNHIVGEFDMHRVASNAAREALDVYRNDVMQNVGRWS